MFCYGPEELRQNQDKKKPELPENETQVVAGGSQERVDPVAIVAEQIGPTLVVYLAPDEALGQNSVMPHNLETRVREAFFETAETCHRLRSPFTPRCIIDYQGRASRCWESRWMMYNKRAISWKNWVSGTRSWSAVQM